jgi:hypothetical protein
MFGSTELLLKTNSGQHLEQVGQVCAKALEHCIA